jgi:hypothetical protein
MTTPTPNITAIQLTDGQIHIYGIHIEYRSPEWISQSNAIHTDLAAGGESIEFDLKKLAEAFKFIATSPGEA